MASESLKSQRDQLIADTSLRGLTFTRELSRRADEWIGNVAKSAPGANAKRIALIATGGYGRGQLAPYSDLDLLVVHSGYRKISTFAEALWYPIWDQGFGLDHAVRTPKEVARVAADDLRVSLGLLDGRCIWGSQELADEVLADVREAWRSHVGEIWLPELETQVRRRHADHGDLADLLEPDIKESHGGLRDLNVLRAIAIAFPDLERFIVASDLNDAEEVLLETRVALHRLAGRDRNKLLLQDQDEVARGVGADDADALMRNVSAAARTVARATDTAWRRRAAWQGDRHGQTSDVRRIEPGIKLDDGEVKLATDVLAGSDPSLPLRLAAVASEHDAPIAIESLDVLASGWQAPAEPWSEEVRGAFLRLLASGPGVIAAVEALEVRDLFTRYLPEWQFVRSYHQRNAYHRYTADRHLLEVVCQGQVMVHEVSRPDLLLFGCLFHDIGKGHPGDHTDVGIEIVKHVGVRMGFSDADTHVLVQLVRHHLLLADTATRRDLDDPATIRHVAAAVGDELTLELLHALTKADGLGTGSTAWGPWKDGLVSELVRRVRDALHGHDVVVAPRDHSDLLGAARTDGVVVRHDGDWIAVAAPDQPRLLATITSVLTLAGVNIRSADLDAEEGIVLDRFFCEPGVSGWPETDHLRSEIAAGLAGERDFPALLARRSSNYQTKRASAHAIATNVTFIPAASDRASVLELRARDSLGLLSLLTRSIADRGLDISAARLSTVGDTAIDTFYLTRDGRPLDSDDEAATVSALSDALATFSAGDTSR